MNRSHLRFLCLFGLYLLLPGGLAAEELSNTNPGSIRDISSPAASTASEEHMQERLNVLWILLCSALVLVMQPGFLCLETGLTRRKNSINVATKNLADFCLAALVFWIVGFGLMFGFSSSGWVGGTRFLPTFNADEPMAGAFFVFQVMFCGATVAIMSGAVAERMRFLSYMVVALLISAWIYPVFGHWVRAGQDSGEPMGWLNRMGFVDFAGASTVHCVGGWMALSVLLIIGPRLGRFSKNGVPQRIPGSSQNTATLGALLLFVGWFGFNGGSTFALNGQVVPILANTLLAASTGAIAAGALGYAIQNRLKVTQFINGCLAGLVASTACCHCVSTHSIVLIGLVAGMIAVGVGQALEQFRIDDAVGAIPVHLGAGVWGTIAVGLYGDLQLLDTGLNRLQQTGVQALGVIVCGVWTLGLSQLILRLVNRVIPLRVSPEEEELGLNLAEHDEMEEGEPQHSSAPTSDVPPHVNKPLDLR